MSRVGSVEASARSKAYGARARAQGRAASAFNRPFDNAMRKASDAAKAGTRAAKQKVKGGGARGNGGAGGAKAGSGGAEPKREGKKMGWLFGKKKGSDGMDRGGGQQARPMQTEPEEYGDGNKTVALNLDAIKDDRGQDVVGWAVALTGNHRGRDFRLVTGKNVLGTSADCDIVLTDPYLSARHATIRHDEGRFTLIDLDSTNGTYLNDKRISKEELIDNDKIRLGKTELKFKSLY
jgi:hypothetical protein